MRFRRTLIASIAGLALVSAAPAFAGQENGEGKNAPGGPYPVDYTAGTPTVVPGLLDAGSTPNGGLAVAVNIGDEGVPGSVGRVAVSGGGSDQLANGDIVSTYYEDYTDGNAVANVIRNINDATGCLLVGMPCGPNEVDASRTDVDFELLDEIP